jgi:hypothetical protein
MRPNIVLGTKYIRSNYLVQLFSLKFKTSKIYTATAYHGPVATHGFFAQRMGFLLVQLYILTVLDHTAFTTPPANQILKPVWPRSPPRPI